ncbi:MAG: FAD:protein transferase [Actinomycetota bacterium]|jgi:thiamine biosynthesis lipoprotein|nr:FAD:protein transferase [Actinomycetota bacterium]
MSVAAAQWAAIGTTARVVVTEPLALDAARRIVIDELAALDLACSRFRADSEIAALTAAAGSWVPVSDVLADVLACALEVARSTDGDVDPTMGSDLHALGYDRDFVEIAHSAEVAQGARGGSIVYAVVSRPTWRDVELDADARRVRIPAGMVIDLGAIAKAWCADRSAARVAAELGCGVLVSLGGDIATAGSGPDGGWMVHVQDRPDVDSGPACTVALQAGMAVATSSTVTRAWHRDGSNLHHILDPATRRPAVPIWRTVTVAAGNCVDANAASTAAIVRGVRATRWLADRHVAARFVGADGAVRTVGGWPQEVAA